MQSLLVIFLLFVSASGSAYSDNLRNTSWGIIAAEKGIDPFELYAVSLMESRKYATTKTITPWPFAINSAGKPIIPSTREEAVKHLENELAKGVRSIDVGLTGW